jgi:hypothetical protein
MLQRALQVAPPHLAPAAFGIRKPRDIHALLYAWVDRALLLLRRLGEFAAAGGPMS